MASLPSSIFATFVLVENFLSEGWRGLNDLERQTAGKLLLRLDLSEGWVYCLHMSLDPMLEVLRREGRQSLASLAERFSLPESEVRAKVSAWEEEGLILGYQAVVDTAKAEVAGVSAFIEVKLTPEGGGGFDRFATRIAKFEQVESCYLASGGYDLMVMVHGEDLMSVARFVSEKLSSMEGVLSTATHFRLKTYKENGFLFGGSGEGERLPVSP